jgi:hypothetical protein
LYSNLLIVLTLALTITSAATLFLVWDISSLMG